MSRTSHAWRSPLRHVAKSFVFLTVHCCCNLAGCHVNGMRWELRCGIIDVFMRREYACELVNVAHRSNGSAAGSDHQRNMITTP
jgi:Holliday junction resolvase-like predicted endonuclease